MKQNEDKTAIFSILQQNSSIKHTKMMVYTQNISRSGY